MKRVTESPQAHIYICTNERPEGKSCCKKVGGPEFFIKMKDRLAQEGLRTTRWVTRTGCLGFCNDVGCVVAIYREGTDSPLILSEIEVDDFETIWKTLTQ